MAENESLSSDLDLIKELEELRLKQKILISSLDNKNKDDFEIYLVEINKKIDFLVKIFKEASEGENTESESEKAHFEELNKKVDSIQSNFDEKFEELNRSISDLKNSIHTVSYKQEIPNTDKNNNIKTDLPQPDFKVNSGKASINEKNKVVEDSSLDKPTEIPTKEGKKKWF